MTVIPLVTLQLLVFLGASSDPLLFLLRFLLILGLFVNTVVCWKLPLVRRVWLFILIPYLSVYVLDGLRDSGLVFSGMSEMAYRKLRQIIAVGALVASVWTFLVTFLAKKLS